MVKTVEPASITNHYVKQEVITLGSMSLNQMWWNIYVCPFVLSISSRGKQQQTFRYPTSLLSRVLEAKLCYDFPNQPSSVFCDAHIKPSASCIPRWWLLVDRCEPDQQCLYCHLWSVLPNINTLPTFIKESPQTWQGQSMMSAADVFSFIANSITAHRRSNTLFTAILLQWITDKLLVYMHWPVFHIAENRHSYQLYKP